MGDVCEIISGTFLKENDYTKTGTPVLKVKDIQDGIIQNGKFPLCNRNMSEEFLVNFGDIVLVNTGKGSVGKVGINLTDLTFLYTVEIFKLIPDKNLVNKKYIYHYLINENKEIMFLVKRGVIQHLYRKTLSKLKLLLPSLKIQQDIANKLDAFAGNNSGIISLLQNQVEQVQQAYEWCRKSLLYR